ncbi:uncharacterized protein LOC129230171 [Uloborus diversus]|uniref:uncharacterized protein LOC129230171 n=1 Tax=Uloborus diversus TaxID=327109 RepID=UPI0024091E73|nr:uncharacterized protein LOC129230171 [Uloborus diversus]
MVTYTKCCKPSKLEEQDHPDWIPSKKMSYVSRASNDDGERYKRRANRKVPLDTSTSATDVEMDLDDGFPTHQDMSVQTDLTMSELNVQEKVLQDFQTELGKTKQKLKKVTLDESSWKEDDEQVYYTGFPTFALLSIVFNVIQPHLNQTQRSVLNKFQKFILTLMHLRLNFDFIDLGYRFGVSNSTASRAFDDCLYVMYQKLHRMVFWPKRTELTKNVSSSFVDAFGKKAIIVIDCFEIKIERPSNILAAAQCYSHYKHSNTVKYLIGISPQGVILSSAAIFCSSARVLLKCSSAKRLPRHK